MGTRRVVAILALAAIAGATVWSPGKSFNYQFNGWIATGIPDIDQQYAGIHLSGRFVVEPETENTIIFALKDTTARKFNQPVDRTLKENPEQWRELGEVVDILDKNILEKPAMVIFKGDEFESLTVSSNEPLWAINMKKALAVKLQLQIAEGKGSKGAFQRLQSGEKMTYPVMENCITGDCEIWYEISELPEDRIKSDPKLIPSPEYCKNGVFYEVVKTVNYDKCIKSPVMVNASPFAWKCVPGTTKCGTSRKRSVTSRTTGCGTSKSEFLVQRKVTVDFEAFKPFGSDTEPLEAMNYDKIELESVQSSRSLSEPKGPKIHSLIYAHSMDQVNGGPIAHPGLKDPVPRRHPPVKVLEKEIRRLISEVVRDLESNTFLLSPEKMGVTTKVGMIRRAAAVLPYEELKSVLSKELAMDQETTEHQLALNILTNAGSNAAIMLLKEHILKGKVTGERLRESISLLPVTLKTPTVEIISEIADLLNSKAAEQDPIFESTVAIALSNIIHQACVNKTLSHRLYPTLVMGEFCSPSEPIIVKKLIPYFAEKIENAESNYEKISFLLALGNLGHEGAIPIIASVIEGEENVEHYLRNWHAKHGLPAEFEAYKKGTKQAFEMEEEEREELAQMSKSKKGSWSKHYFQELAMGSKAKRDLRSRFGEESFFRSKGGYGTTEEEEEEEYELSDAQRRNYGIPKHEKINKGILKKYGVPMEEVMRSGYGEEETEYELTKAQRRKFGIPERAKINKGTLRKYGVPMSEVESDYSDFKFGGRKSKSLFEEEEEEYELTPSQRRKFGIPEHESKINMGILKKYNVPVEEATSLPRKSRGIKSYFQEEAEEEYELTPAQRRKYSIPSNVEKINKGILRKYGVPMEDVKEKSYRDSKSQNRRFEEEEEEYELSHAQRKKYGIPADEKINKGILRKYGVPMEAVEFESGRSTSAKSWESSGRGRHGKKNRRAGKSHKKGRKGGKDTLEYESDTIPRMVAVAALKKLALAENPKTIHLLGSIFFNTNEDPEVRLIALKLLFLADAPMSMWDRVAVGTWFEPSYQVQHYVTMALHSISTIENPTFRSRMTKARSVLPLLKPMTFSFTGSSAYLGSYYDVEEDIGYYFGASTVYSNSSFLPIKAFVDMGLKQGHFEFSAARFGILGQQLSELAKQFLPKTWTQTEKTNPELERIREHLNIETRGGEEAPEAYFYGKVMNGLERIWPINEETPKYLAQSFGNYFKTKGDDINYRSWDSFGDIYAVVPMAMGIPLLVDNHWFTMNSIVGNVNATSREVEAELSGNWGIEVISSLAYNVPFVGKLVGAGVEMNTWIALPVPSSMCLKSDASRGKMSVEWEPMRGKMSVLSHYVKPFTATKDFSDLTPFSQATDLKIVMKHDGPLEVNIPLSEKLLGVETNVIGIKANVLHKADSKHLTYLATWNKVVSEFTEGRILNRMFGIPSDSRYRDTKIVFDIPASETKAIRIDFDVAAAAQPIGEDVTVVRSGTKREAEVSQSTKDKVEVIYGKLDEIKTENFMSVFESTIGGQAVTVDASIEFLGTSTRKYEASVTLGRGGLGLVQKGSIHIQNRAGSRSTNKICFDAEVNWPKLTSLKREYYLGTDLTTSFSLTLGHGANCENRRNFAVNGKMTQTAEQIAYAKSSPEAVMCKKLETEENVMVASEACEEARNQASNLNRYEFEFDYPSSPSEALKNLTVKVENFLKFVGYRHLSENVNVKNENKKIKVVVELDPVSQDKVNVEIFNPRSNIFFTGVPLGPISRSVLPINVRLPFIANIMNIIDVCGIEGKRVNTFDNTLYETELSNCDHLLASDCSGTYDIAVLGREEKGNKITTIIFQDDKVVIDPASKKVTVNGKEQPLVEDKVVITVDQSGMTNLIVREVGDGFSEVIVPGFGKVIASSDKIFLMTYGAQRGAVCGMCGTGNSESASDLEGPRGCTLSSGKHLAAAYMLDTPKATCNPEKANRRA